MIAATIAVLPAIAGCSSFSSPWSSASDTNYRPAPPPAPAASTMGQPANLPPGQSVAAQPSYGAAAPQPPRKNTAIGYGDPAPAYSPPPRPYTTAATAPASPSAYAAAQPASSAQKVDPGGGVYPSQSLFDLFKDSTDSGSSRPGNVVHPPNTYTPVGSSGGATAPAASDPAANSGGVYPQQSIADIFSGQ